tara:strand:+ start:9688 stop:10635 length:948 start_codon:yes stop_codon:yes gene_type:complete
MSQDNIQTDTPQEGTTDKQYQSLEEAVFQEGFSDEGSSIADVFTTGEDKSTTEAPAQGQPADSTEVQTNEVTTDNDTKRYQYWQSQADKMKSENARLQNQLKAQSQQVPQPVAQPKEEVVTKESFPPPPAKPLKPAHFNREEAYSDPTSDSAKYMDSIEQWRDDITEYNSIKSEFETSIVQEKMDKIEANRIANAKRFEARQIEKQQKNEVYQYVTGHHGLSRDEAVDFIKTMSSPKSVNLDNLVSLYRLNSGGAPKQGNPAQPSQDFQQMKNAQQVPSPMGVMPSGQSNADSRSLEDKMIDKMIGDFNSKNPWK